MLRIVAQLPGLKVENLNSPQVLHTPGLPLSPGTIPLDHPVCKPKSWGQESFAAELLILSRLCASAD